jgi:methylthioribulose-1-phosphate dehydratase
MADERDELIRAGRLFDRRGWVEGTGGNLSARAAAGGFWITASGSHKGELTREDFVRVDIDGTLLETGAPGRRPSAEVAIHQTVYRLFPQTGAVYHVHSTEANVVSLFSNGPMLRLAPLEVLKGFRVMEDNPRVEIPLLPNWSNVAQIAADMHARLANSPPPRIPAALIRLHGITVWGPDALTARHYVELLEYILRFMVQARSAGVEEDW